MSSTDRLHALDAVRAFALIAGVFFHGAAGYIENFPPLLWPMREPSSTTLALLFFVTHMFRMSLFFLIAGFFGRMLIERKGTRAFIRDRVRRILLPLVVGLPVILLLFVGLGGLGFLLGGMSWSDLQALQAQQQSAQSTEAGGFPWAHLWFLYYLLLFYTGALIIRAVARAADASGRVASWIDGAVRFCLGGVWGAAAIGLLLAAYFYNLDRWPSWTGLPAPLIFAPHPPSVIAYGTAFGFGWLAHRQTDRLLELDKRWSSFIVLAVALTIGSLYIGGVTPRFEAYLGGRTLMWFTAAYLVGAWCWIFGLIGFTVRYFSNPSPVRRYIADSSYWLYLMHLPVIAFFAAWWNPLPWHWTIKYPLQVGTTFVVLFVSYRYLVRPTFIGATLNGRRYPASLTVAAEHGRTEAT